MQLWIALNYVLFALLYTGISPPLGNFLSKAFLSEESRAFAMASVAIGFAFAWIAFVTSVVSVPMLIDREIDGLTAVRISVKASLGSVPAIILWASSIVLVVGVGLICFYIGLVMALPLIGHATWNTHRDLVPPSNADSSGLLAAGDSSK